MLRNFACVLIGVFTLVAVHERNSLLSPASAKTVEISLSNLECDSSSDPCIRVYTSLEDVEKQSYKVVKFTEAEIYQSLDKDGGTGILRRIKDDTGFECKNGKESYGFFRCDPGALATRHELLFKILSGFYH